MAKYNARVASTMASMNANSTQQQTHLMQRRDFLLPCVHWRFHMNFMRLGLLWRLDPGWLYDAASSSASASTFSALRRRRDAYHWMPNKMPMQMDRNPSSSRLASRKMLNCSRSNLPENVGGRTRRMLSHRSMRRCFRVSACTSATNPNNKNTTASTNTMYMNIFSRPRESMVTAKHPSSDNMMTTTPNTNTANAATGASTDAAVSAMNKPAAMRTTPNGSSVMEHDCSMMLYALTRVTSRTTLDRTDRTTNRVKKHAKPHSIRLRFTKSCSSCWSRSSRSAADASDTMRSQLVSM